MKKLTYLLTALCFSVLLGGCGSDNSAKDAGAPQVLNLYGWADYFDPDVISDFEKQNNCKITYDVFSNNEELLAKMQAGGAQFDIIMPSDYMVTTMRKLDMLEKLDLAKIPNAKYISADLRKLPFDPTVEYTLPYTTGITGIIYNKKYVKETPAKWDDLWNSEYKGHVLLLNDCREVFSVALKKHGWSNNSTDPAQVEAAFKDLKQLNSSVIAYDTENLKQKFIAEEGWIGIMWSGDAAFTYRENNNVGFVVPDQGSLIWSDNFAIPKGCKNKELAEKFMNYMYDPKVSAKNWEFMNCANPNDEALKYHSQAYLDDPMLKIGKESIPKGEWLTDIGDSITMYDRYWTELKAGQ